MQVSVRSALKRSDTEATLMNLPLIVAFGRRARHAGHVALVMSLATIFPSEAAMRIEQKTITVEHIEIHSDLRFDEVASRLESSLPPINPTIMDALASGDQGRAEKLIAGTNLFIFLKRNHGELLKVAGSPRKAVQYEIGNPLTATTMTRHKLAASLYAPLRVTLYENETGGCTFAYGQPSSLLGQFGDAQVADIAHALDEKLKAALLRAAD